MSDYSQSTNFTAKDALNTGDPNKLIKGSEFDAEFSAVEAASATKANKITPTATGNLALLGSGGDLTDGGTPAAFKGSVIPAGTKMLFVQAAAPTGWTQDNTVNDRVLRVVDNTGTGAATGGSWTVSGLVVDGHALTVDEMPAHTHDIVSRTLTTGASGTSAQEASASAGADTADMIQSTGGGSTHTHGQTSSDGVWRPSYVDAIVCSKDAY